MSTAIKENGNPKKRYFNELDSTDSSSYQSPLKRQRTYISTRSKSNKTLKKQSKNNDNKELPNELQNKLQDNPSSMLLIGTCHRYLFGIIKYQSYAQPGDVKLRYEPKKKSIFVDVASSDIVLGKTDVQIANAFGDFMRHKQMTLKGMIMDVDVSKIQTRLQRKQPCFVRKLLIEVYAHYDIIQSLMTKCKAIKHWKWKNKSPILRYFDDEQIEYDELYQFINQYTDTNINNLVQGYDEMLLRIEADFNQIFNDDIAAHNLKGSDPNPDIVKTQLLQYQRIGFEWMSLRENFENNDEIPPFYEEIEHQNKYKYRNIISNEEIDLIDLPELGCGGILADDMGLGKTLQCIALIASNSGYGNQHQDDKKTNGPTLIVTPVAVMSNWQRQIKNHCVDKAFKVLIYHGTDREKDVKHIEKYDIVITTYGTLSSEYCNSDSNQDREYMRKHYGIGLQYVNWLRVVLDEAHRIRSRKTKKFKACDALYAKSRWCLTGTPLQNRLDDLYSLFLFLRLQPICDRPFWDKFIVDPLKNNDQSGLETLRTIVSYFCLRRLKKGLLKNLPPKITKCRELEFIPKERAKYDQLLAIQKAQFTKMKNGGDKEIMRNFTSVLSMLLRLRQCCAHILLVPQFDNNLNENNLRLAVLEDVNEECASCGMPPDISIFTTCHHIYCEDCFLYELETYHGKFPCYLCGAILTTKSIVEKRQNKAESEELKDNNNTNNRNKIKHKKSFVFDQDKIEPSTKMQTLINDIKSWNQNNNGDKLPDKAVVFSQWTLVLDLLGICLDQEDIEYERIDGSMSAKQRVNAMDNFKNMSSNNKIKVILISLKAGCEGIDLSAANYVYLLDPWWNPSTEDQAIDRVYRLGQTRTVIVNHFVIKNSVEEKILQIQDRKRELISSTLQSNLDMKRNRRSELLQNVKELFDF